MVTNARAISNSSPFSTTENYCPQLAFNPRGSLEHKRFVYLVYRACSLPAWLVSFLNHALSCTCTISVCQYTTLQLRLSRRSNQNATVEGCSVLSDCRKAGVQTKDGVRTLGPVWMPIRRAGQTTALVSAVAQSQLWRSSTSPSLAS